ncbi:MAG TPA: PucR family transcriptional regulator ligand-binding domain-containing protein [Actinomycetota bacterium]|nr:PucR family transcriptional regulator ligand-binding domain-containing protein [Actinomycetota bacterium]
MTAVRVTDILNLPGLALKLVAGRGGRNHPVRWVHVSELEDPTPWLKGGELLLTTGMGLGKTPSRQRAYVQRLADARLAGLGFGTGFSFEKVPRGVIEAADRLRFPVFDVPYPVPFIAITEAVFTRLAAEQYDVLRRSLEAQNGLTRAVLEGEGPPGIAAALAQAIEGWVVVLDVHGVALAAAPPSARGRASPLWEELRDSRPHGPGFSLSLADRGDHVSVQPVGARGRVEGFLAIGKRDAITQFDGIVASHALSLLAIEMDKSRAVAAAERRLKGGFFDALVRGGLPANEAARGLRRFGFDGADRIAVVAVEAPVSIEELTTATEDVLSLGEGAFLTAPRDDVLCIVVRPNGEAGVEELRREVSARLGAEVLAGAGSTVPPAEAGRSLREATYALQVCRVEGRSFADFRSLGTYRLLLTLQEPDALRAFADSILAPLDRYDADHAGELVPSLAKFLHHNARWEAAAEELYVHRHTLRYRMRKVEELTRRDLSSAHDRMEFWLALRARDLLSSGAEPQ